MIPLNMRYFVKLIETESRTGFARGRGVVGIRSYCLMGTQFIIQDENYRGTWWRWLYNIMNLFNTTDLYT